MSTILPIVLEHAPTAASWLLGDRSGAVSQEVSKLAKAIFGTDDPEALAWTLEADPAKAPKFHKAVIDAESAARQRKPRGQDQRRRLRVS